MLDCGYTLGDLLYVHLTASSDPDGKFSADILQRLPLACTGNVSVTSSTRERRPSLSPAPAPGRPRATPGAARGPGSSTEQPRWPTPWSTCACKCRKAWRSLDQFLHLLTTLGPAARAGCCTRSRRRRMTAPAQAGRPQPAAWLPGTPLQTRTAKRTGELSEPGSLPRPGCCRLGCRRGSARHCTGRPAPTPALAPRQSHLLHRTCPRGRLAFRNWLRCAGNQRADALRAAKFDMYIYLQCSQDV